MNDNDMHVNISGKAGDSSISAATIGHISKVASKLDWFSNVSIQYLADDIIRNPMAIQDGKIILKSGLGLGIDVDEEKISQYAI
jgi:L-alanine-DL-glutamate epimerase-like enolase superfamily enzyme